MKYDVHQLRRLGGKLMVTIEDLSNNTGGFVKVVPCIVDNFGFERTAKEMGWDSGKHLMHDALRPLFKPSELKKCFLHAAQTEPRSYRKRGRNLIPFGIATILVTIGDELDGNRWYPNEYPIYIDVNTSDIYIRETDAAI